LWNSTDTPDILNRIQNQPDIETLQYVPGMLIWHIPEGGRKQSKVSKIAGTALYRQMTIRNVRTTAKLQKLLANAS